MSPSTIRTPSRTASAGSGIRSMSASPIVLTNIPLPPAISARTEVEKSSTSCAASRSPCASVKAVKPAMSANMNAAVGSLTATSQPLGLVHASEHGVREHRACHGDRDAAHDDATALEAESDPERMFALGIARHLECRLGCRV